VAAFAEAFPGVVARLARPWCMSGGHLGDRRVGLRPVPGRTMLERCDGSHWSGRPARERRQSESGWQPAWRCRSSSSTRSSTGQGGATSASSSSARRWARWSSGRLGGRRQLPGSPGPRVGSRRHGGVARPARLVCGRWPRARCAGSHAPNGSERQPEPWSNFYRWDRRNNIVRWAWVKHANYVERYGAAMDDPATAQTALRAADLRGRHRPVRSDRALTERAGAHQAASTRTSGRGPPPTAHRPAKRAVDVLAKQCEHPGDARSPPPQGVGPRPADHGGPAPRATAGTTSAPGGCRRPPAPRPGRPPRRGPRPGRACWRRCVELAPAVVETTGSADAPASTAGERPRRSRCL